MVRTLYHNKCSLELAYPTFITQVSNSNAPRPKADHSITTIGRDAVAELLDVHPVDDQWLGLELYDEYDVRTDKHLVAEWRQQQQAWAHLPAQLGDNDHKLQQLHDPRASSAAGSTLSAAPPTVSELLLQYLKEPLGPLVRAYAGAL